MKYTIASLLLLAACGTIDDATLPEPPAPPVPVATAPGGTPAAMTAPAEVTTAKPETGMPDPADLIGMSKPELRIARNNVFARRGRAFTSEDLRTHFESQAWYTVDPAYSDDDLTEAEKEQVALIASFETDRDPTQTYQFSGTPRILFPEEGVAVVVPSDDIYEGMVDPVHYTAHGDWVLTWGGPSPYNASTAQDATLHRLDYDASTVIESVSL